MIDKVATMSNIELEQIVYDYNCPSSVKEAILYMQNCEKDMGFMGSPHYIFCKRIVDEYNDKLNNNYGK